MAQDHVLIYYLMTSRIFWFQIRNLSKNSDAENLNGSNTIITTKVKNPNVGRNKHFPRGKENRGVPEEISKKGIYI